MFKDFETPLHSSEYESFNEQSAHESFKSWQQTLKSTIESYRTFDVKERAVDFDATLSAFISQVESLAHPDRPGTDEGDHAFYEAMQFVKGLIEEAKRGGTLDEHTFDLDDALFRDVPTKDKLERLLKARYQA